MKLIHFGVAAREGLTTNCLVTTEYRPSFASRRIISVFTVAVNEARTSVMEVTVDTTATQPTTLFPTTDATAIGLIAFEAAVGVYCPVSTRGRRGGRCA